MHKIALSLIIIVGLTTLGARWARAQGDELPEWDPGDTYQDFIFEDEEEQEFLSHISVSFLTGAMREISFFKTEKQETVTQTEPAEEPFTLADGSVIMLTSATRTLESSQVSGLTLGFNFSPVYSAVVYFGYANPTAVLTGEALQAGDLGIIEKTPVDMFFTSVSFQYRKKVGRFTPFGNAGVGGIFVDSDSEDIANSDLSFNLALGLDMDVIKRWAFGATWRGFFYKWDFTTLDGSNQRLGQGQIELINTFVFELYYAF